MTTIENLSNQKTDFAEFEAWLDDLDFADGYERNRRIVTGKGAFVVTVTPLVIGDQAVRFDVASAETPINQTEPTD